MLHRYMHMRMYMYMSMYMYVARVCSCLATCTCTCACACACSVCVATVASFSLQILTCTSYVLTYDRPRPSMASKRNGPQKLHHPPAFLGLSLCTLRRSGFAGSLGCFCWQVYARANRLSALATPRGRPRTPGGTSTVSLTSGDDVHLLA